MAQGPGKILRVLRDTPLFWALAAFVLYFWYAQFIVTVAWNAIELIIAQHLLDHGVYATSVDYPSAITWRPVVPTLLVTFLRIFNSEPILLYRIVCGVSLGTLTATMFLGAKIAWGRVAAHIAALLTIVCPAITVYLVNHVHSYSHVIGLFVLGPTLLISLFLLKARPPESTLSWPWYAAGGAAWGLTYLCRSELLLYFALHLVMLAWLLWRSRRSLRPLVTFVLVFAVFFASYNVYADYAANKGGVVIRKTIYGMYISQGWVDPPPNVTADIEADGYVYAQQLYGDPIANHESLLRAIRNNPAAFQRRVLLNLHSFYAKYFDSAFFPAAWSLLIVGVLGWLLMGRVPRGERRFVLFLFGLFAASHFVLMFHIDARYLSINIPPLILLASFGVRELARLSAPRSRWLTATAVGAALVCLLVPVRGQLDAFRNHRERNTESLVAMRSLGRHFQKTVPAPVLFKNREPHLSFIFPAQSALFPEDQFLLAYFSHTSWDNGGAEGKFPRGKFYSYRDCEVDYRYIPEERIGDKALIGKGKIIGDYVNPVLGRYYLVQMNP